MDAFLLKPVLTSSMTADAHDFNPAAGALLFETNVDVEADFSDLDTGATESP